MFHQSRSQTKIARAFGVVVVASILAGLFGYFAVHQTSSQLDAIAGARVQAAMAVGEMNASLNEVAAGLSALQSGHLLNDAESYEAGHAQVEKGLQRLDQARKLYEALPRGNEELRTWNSVQQAHDAWKQQVLAILAALRDRDQLTGAARDSRDLRQYEERALRLWTAQRHSKTALAGSLEELLKATRASLEEERTSALSAASTSAWGILLVLLVGAGVTSLVGIFLARDIGGMWDRIGSLVARFAKGDSTPRTGAADREDFNALLDRFGARIESLEGLCADVSRMSSAHQAGDVDATIDASRFPGDLHTVAQGINAMVESHIAARKKAMEVVAQFGQGNFDAPLAQPPGKNRFVSDSIEQVRASLRSFLAEVERMSRAHEAGDIDAAIDTARFQGSWRTLAQGINGMVESHIAAKKKAMEVVAQFGQGNFDAPLEQLPGKKRFINDTIEQVRASL
ncbi:MAG TPA: Tar ligand binding domain-containing protein [Anaeromyxobacteraceae bacterium]|nr:Tar ligand binding domain-containing protein [Anaeromyxobacteraceae bacterium]